MWSAGSCLRMVPRGGGRGTLAAQRPSARGAIGKEHECEGAFPVSQRVIALRHAFIT